MKRGFEILELIEVFKNYSRDIMVNETRHRWRDRCLITYSLSSRFTEYQLNFYLNQLKIV